jgi:hypothetical protein
LTRRLSGRKPTTINAARARVIAVYSRLAVGLTVRDVAELSACAVEELIG